MPFKVTGGKYALQTLTAVGTNTVTVNAAVPFVTADFPSIQRIACLYTPGSGNVVTNGDFASDTAWTKGSGVTISGGSANFVSSAAMISQNVPFVVGQQYIVNLQYTRTAGASLVFCNSLTNGVNNITTVATVNTATLTTITFAFTAVGDGFLIAASGNVFSGTIDNIVIRASAVLKGIAYVRAATSTTSLQLETPFYDHATGIVATQVVGDNILISKNWAECATAGWSIANGVSSITDFATIGVLGDEAGACIYDESRVMQSAIGNTTTPPVILLGGVWVQGHLQDYATNQIYGACDFIHTSTSAFTEGGVQARDLAAHYIVYGGKRTVANGVIIWEPMHQVNTICRAKTLIWRKVDAQAGILGPGDGGAPWWPGTESRMQFIDCSAEILTGFNVCWRPGNAVVTGGSAKIVGNNALSVFGSGYNGFAIAAPAGQRFIVSDVRSGGFWDQYYSTPSTANFTNVLTPVTTVTRASGVVTFNWYFKAAYQNLGIGSLIQILTADGTTTETSVTTTTTNTDLTVLARTHSGAGTANPPQTYNNASWTYAIWKYGSVPIAGSFAQSAYSLGTAGSSLDVVHGGFFSQAIDTDITQTNAATVAAYTTLADYSQAYDYSMYYKALNITNMKWLGIANQIFAVSGTTLVATFANLVFDNAAASMFVQTSNTLTLKNTAGSAKFTAMSAASITVAASTTVSGGLIGPVTNSGTVSGEITGNVVNSGTLTGTVTGNVTNTGTLSSGASITGNVSQATPADLTGVTVTGNLTFNTNTPVTITLTNTTISGTVSNSGTALVTVVLAGTSTVGTAGANISVQVLCSVAVNGGNTFNLVKRYGSPGSYTDLGYSAGLTSDSFLVPKGQPVEVAIWTLGYLTFTRTIQTTNGGFSLLADMIPEPDVDVALDVSAYLANISVTYGSGTFTATFNANMSVPGIEPAKAILHRLLGLEGSMRALLPPGMSTTVDVEPDEIQLNKPAVFLVLGSGATDVSIAGFFNTGPAKVIDPAYIINPRRVSDNLRVEIPLVKPALDVSALAAAVRAELATELAQVTKVAKLHGVGASLVVTPTTRVAGTVSQTISTDGTTTTVAEV
jgi:hypothetical protein